MKHVARLTVSDWVVNFHLLSLNIINELSVWIDAFLLEYIMRFSSYYKIYYTIIQHCQKVLAANINPTRSTVIFYFNNYNARLIAELMLKSLSISRELGSFILFHSSYFFMYLPFLIACVMLISPVSSYLFPIFIYPKST